MKKEGYYSSGEFAKKAHVTKKTIRYYDEHNILKPSFVSVFISFFPFFLSFCFFTVIIC